MIKGQSQKFTGKDLKTLMSLIHTLLNNTKNGFFLDCLPYREPTVYLYCAVFSKENMQSIFTKKTLEATWKATQCSCLRKEAQKTASAKLQ